MTDEESLEHLVLGGHYVASYDWMQSDGSPQVRVLGPGFGSFADTPYWGLLVESNGSDPDTNEISNGLRQKVIEEGSSNLEFVVEVIRTPPSSLPQGKYEFVYIDENPRRLNLVLPKIPGILWPIGYGFQDDFAVREFSDEDPFDEIELEHLIKGQIYRGRFTGRYSNNGNPRVEIGETGSEERSYFGFVITSNILSRRGKEYQNNLRTKLIAGEIDPNEELLVKIYDLPNGSNPEGPYNVVIQGVRSSRNKTSIEPLKLKAVYEARFMNEGAKGDPYVEIFGLGDGDSASYFGFVKPNLRTSFRESSNAIRQEMLNSGDTERRYKVMVVSTPTEGEPMRPYFVVAAKRSS